MGGSCDLLAPAIPSLVFVGRIEGGCGGGGLEGFFAV